MLRVVIFLFTLLGCILVVNGAWSKWSAFSTHCTKRCGGGVLVRTRCCEKEQSGIECKDCKGDAFDTKPCNEEACPADRTKVNGKWGGWAPYSACEKTCGRGVQSRSRVCDNPVPSNGGARCTGPREESRTCNSGVCPMNGKWGGWGPYSACDKTCGRGVQSRSRVCDNPVPSNGGAPCTGPREESRTCNPGVCPKAKCLQRTTRGDCCAFPFLYNSERHNHCIGRRPWCSLSYKYQNKWGRCQNNGQWTTWSAYSICSRTCGRGFHSRTRVCTNPKYCPSADTRETAACNTKACPVDKDVGGKENPGKNCKHIKDNRSKSPVKSGIYWIEIGGQKREVYCDMDIDGGGWTLVWSYTFTDFAHFGNGKNAVTPRPDWPTDKNKGTVPTSATAPVSETDYNALDFKLWKDVGHEFMVKSNINNWISCRENGGSLVDWKNGGLACRVVNNLTGKCGHIAPDKIEMTTRDYWGAHSTGPNLYSSHSQGWLKTYYYFEDSTAGVNWPTHDPCSKNQLNHLRVANPHGNIYIR